MVVRLKEYIGMYKIVSLAFNEMVKNDLEENKLDYIYITDENIILYPENKLLSSERQIISHLKQANNYDVYELFEDGRLLEYYNDQEADNYFLVTGKCNSNCIMCPSPDISRKKGESNNSRKLIDIAKHIPSDAPHLTITGGEPFMIGKEIFSFLSFLKDKFENTEFLLLTNGRIFALDEYVEKLYECLPEDCIIGIPVHGATAEIHDAVTQVKNSFAQTINGIKKLLKKKLKIEIRIVVSRLNIADINNIAKLLVDELPGIHHVSIIAMEMTGSAYVNREKVWIPYKEAANKIEAGIYTLIKSGIDVKLYNFPLCTVNPEFWTLCEQSISPSKVRYVDACEKCTMKKICSGIFAGTVSMEKEELEAIV